MGVVGSDTVVVAGWVLEERLGGGSFGEVWKARRQHVAVHRALKLLRVAGDDEFEAWRQETVRLEGLSHPNIVRFYDADVVADGPYQGFAWIATELCERSLAEEMRIAPGGVLGSAACEQLLADMLGALAAARAGGCVHRDVKPANILRHFDGTWKLADFGTARLLSPDTTHPMTKIIGTQAYMSPDAHNGRQNHAADLYALGVTLHEALSGRRLHPRPERMSDGEYRGLVVESPPTIDPLLPPRWRTVIESLIGRHGPLTAAHLSTWFRTTRGRTPPTPAASPTPPTAATLPAPNGNDPTRPPTAATLPAGPSTGARPGSPLDGRQPVDAAAPAPDVPDATPRTGRPPTPPPADSTPNDARPSSPPADPPPAPPLDHDRRPRAAALAPDVLGATPRTGQPPTPSSPASAANDPRPPPAPDHQRPPLPHDVLGATPRTGQPPNPPSPPSGANDPRPPAGPDHQHRPLAAANDHRPPPSPPANGDRSSTPAVEPSPAGPDHQHRALPGASAHDVLGAAPRTGQPPTPSSPVSAADDRQPPASPPAGSAGPGPGNGLAGGWRQVLRLVANVRDRKANPPSANGVNGANGVRVTEVRAAQRVTAAAPVVRPQQQVIVPAPTPTAPPAAPPSPTPPPAPTLVGQMSMARRRIVAAVLDLLVVAILGGICWAMVVRATGDAVPATSFENPGNACGTTDDWSCVSLRQGDTVYISDHAGLATLGFLVPCVALMLVVQGKTGRTPGKLLLGLRLTRSDGQRPGVPRLVMRTAAGAVDMFPGLPVIGVLAVLGSHGRRRFADVVVGTRVVNA